MKKTLRQLWAWLNVRNRLLYAWRWCRFQWTWRWAIEETRRRKFAGKTYWCADNNHFLYAHQDEGGLVLCGGFTEYYSDAQSNIIRQWLSRRFLYVSCFPVEPIDQFERTELTSEGWKVKEA